MNYDQGIRGNNKLPTIEAYLNWYVQKSLQPVKLVLPLMGCGGVCGLNKQDVIRLYRKFFEREVSFAWRLSYTDTVKRILN